MSKNKLFLFCILFNLKCVLLCTPSKYPADISFLVSDFKYSQEEGLKICEIQHGSLSAFEGDLYLSGGDGAISPLIADFFSLFPIKKWGAGLIYPPLKRSLIAKEWIIDHSLRAFLKDPLFLKCARSPPLNPSSITSHAGVLYDDFDVIRNFKSYIKAYPGILFVNAATFPYWRDKYKMNALFDLNDELKQYKAEWRLYPKKYNPLLSEKIQKEIPSELYVIKPRSEILAKGVIVVRKRDLDHVLKTILEPLPSLENHPDKKYTYWLKNKDDTFLIEKYYKSDYLCFPHPLNEKTSFKEVCHYDATMRIAFILYYNEGKMGYHPLGGFWKLPSKALEEEGTLNEQKISCCKAPFYHSIDSELLEEVNLHMEKAMLLLYERMLY